MRKKVLKGISKKKKKQVEKNVIAARRNLGLNNSSTTTTTTTRTTSVPAKPNRIRFRLQDTSSRRMSKARRLNLEFEENLERIQVHRTIRSPTPDSDLDSD